MAFFSESKASHQTESVGGNLCAVTDVGRARDQNEDNFVLSASGHLWVVADGMGGAEAGEVASSLAVVAVANSLADESWVAEPDADQIKKRLLAAFASAHRKVLGTAKREKAKRGMGTTLIAGVVTGNHLVTCHVGDVRCYVHDTAGLHRITRDHTVLQLLVEAGKLTPDEAQDQPERNLLYQAVGIPGGITPEVNMQELEKGARVLLCSDGLWEALTDGELAAILGQKGTIPRLAKRLVERANAAGGRDNITAVLYQHQ